jgi:hypothetical protein
MDAGIEVHEGCWRDGGLEPQAADRDEGTLSEVLVVSELAVLLVEDFVEALTEGVES